MNRRKKIYNVKIEISLRTFMTLQGKKYLVHVSCSKYHDEVALHSVQHLQHLKST